MRSRLIPIPAVLLLASLLASLLARHVAAEEPSGPDGQVLKVVLGKENLGADLVGPDRWRAYELGFARDGEAFVCDNGADAKARRGVSQTVVLNQSTPEPIVAIASSKAEGVTGSPDSGYSIYLDLQHEDGTPLWGQTASFDVGTHDWQQRRVVVVPEKPVKSVAMYLLFRGHGGKAWFRKPRLHTIKAPEGACLFDGVPVRIAARPGEGFQVRDVAAGSDFVRIGRAAQGLKLHKTKTDEQNVSSLHATITDLTGTDRAVTLVYSLPLPAKNLRWLHDPRRSQPVEPPREYMNASRFAVGANGRLSRYPFAAVADEQSGFLLGIDMTCPAFFRAGYNAAAEELFVAYDLALTPERPSAAVRLVSSQFGSKWGFRAALAKYYAAFPEAFRCRTPRQGLWMPFARISEVKGWEDFGFQFKEGSNETAWDDAHGMTTFRYTEPMTWWMRLPEDMPRTMEAACSEARRLATSGNKQARALLTSGFHDESGRFSARLRDTPWCDGAVWSMNSLPGIPGGVTDFSNKWNEELRERLYGPKRQGDLDGEYVDSSEGYVTDVLDFRRDHFAAADTPLCFSPHTHRPAIFRGLIAFEYVRGIERDVRAMDKLMMANGAPTRLCWLCPMLDVMGTETNWHRGGKWQPMSDADMLYRRAMCKGKPYCFLMNTEFEGFGPELVERYMKRSLAFGMFPGFFSHNASQGHYFTRPALYDRDRPLFKKYVPLCRRVAEAGWEPITLARSSDESVYVERFGDRYLTVINDSRQERTATITLDGLEPAMARSRDLVSARTITWQGGKARVTLAGEDVAVIDLGEFECGAICPGRHTEWCLVRRTVPQGRGDAGRLDSPRQ